MLTTRTGFECPRSARSLASWKPPLALMPIPKASLAPTPLSSPIPKASLAPTPLSKPPSHPCAHRGLTSKTSSVLSNASSTCIVSEKILSQSSSFESTFAEHIRRSLGDWRDSITWPDSIWSDLGTRADFYVDLGFDADLTDFPASAFREATTAAKIRSDPPPLVEAYGPPVPSASDPVEEAALARTNEAHNWLQRLESQLRCFIDHAMTDTFGTDWPARQLPNNKYDEWSEKKEAADRSNSHPRPLIAYADFTDYERIICRRDNWDQVFSSHFERPESVRESFQRLYPIRHDTMHARPITQDDELLLYIETKRLMRPIASL